MALFITLEGVEGCGKTTQARLLADWLRGRGERVVTTREPGGCPIADRLRSVLLDPGCSEITPDTELLLYAAARAQHVSEVIRPALAAGSSVVCDRYTDATLAYQGYARGLDLERIAQLNDFATGETRPDLSLLLDYPPELGLQRARQRNETQTVSEGRFEAEELACHQRVRDGYLQIALDNPRMLIIDACGTVSDVQQRLLAATTAYLRQRKSA